MAVEIVSGCRNGQDIVWSYGGGEFDSVFNADGRAEFVVDCFVGATSAIEIVLQDGTQIVLPVEVADLDRMTKIALLWRAPVALEMHVFEYAAAVGQPGHVHAGAKSTFADAREQMEKSGRGRGFMSAATAGDTIRDRLEVYTFLHKDGQTSGHVATAVDHATRGATPGEQTCGKGQLAEVPFRTIVLSRKGQIVREAGVIAAAECGQTLSEDARYSTGSLPVIRFRH